MLNSRRSFVELSNKPSLALYMGCPEQFVPDQIKNQRLQPFLPPPGKGVNPDPPRGEENQSSEQDTKETQSGHKGPLTREGQSTNSKNQEDLGTIESLKTFSKSYAILKIVCQLCLINLMMYIISMALFIYLVTQWPSQKLVWSQKGWVFAPLQGLQTLVILSRIWLFSKEKQDSTCMIRFSP